MTTARYYTPNGRSIQAKGIEPDIKLNTPYAMLPDAVKGRDRIFNRTDIIVVSPMGHKFTLLQPFFSGHGLRPSREKNIHNP